MFIKEIEFVIKNIPKMTIPDPGSFPGEFYKMFKVEIILILHKHFQKVWKEKTCPDLCYEASIILLAKPEKDILRKLQAGILAGSGNNNFLPILANEFQQCEKWVMPHDQLEFISGFQV